MKTIQKSYIDFFYESFYQTSEVDQELDCEMHPTKYKVTIGCDVDWPP